MTGVKYFLVRDFQDLFEEGPDRRIGRLLLGSLQHDGKTNSSAIELALMVEAHAGKCPDQSSGCDQPFAGKDDGATLFVMVLKETREMILIIHWSFENAVDR